MMVGDPSLFAIESHISKAEPNPSLRALGFFLIHLGGREFGVRSHDASMLANSFDGVGRRIEHRGTHVASFAQVEAATLAQAVVSSQYSEAEFDYEGHLGVGEDEFRGSLFSRGLLWAPDGDAAFDDGSHVLQFDTAAQNVRLVGFVVEDHALDFRSIRDIMLSADVFYEILARWFRLFESERKAGLMA